MTSFLSIPDSAHYWLRNGRVPLALVNEAARRSLSTGLQRGLADDAIASVDIEVLDGQIIALRSASLATEESLPSVDLHAGLVWPCFVDMHTHLDKGHIWPRSPNPDGTFAGALETVHQDSAQRWEAQDVYRRMEFGLKCSYAHGNTGDSHSPRCVWRSGQN